MQTGGGWGPRPQTKKRKTYSEKVDEDLAAMDPDKVVTITITIDRDSGVTDIKITAPAATKDVE